MTNQSKQPSKPTDATTKRARPTGTKAPKTQRSPKATKKTSRSQPSAAKGRKRQTSKKQTSVLDAAATVLADAAPKTMNCKEMIDAIFERKLWTTTGKTPAATLSSAILREIQKQGDQARFEKVERGRFRIRPHHADPRPRPRKS